MKRKIFAAVILMALLCSCGNGNAEEQSEASKKEVYSGEGYELSYDTDKWNIAFEAENGMVCFVRSGFDGVSFAVEYYPYNTGAADESGISVNERIEALKQSCEENDGQVFISGEVLEIDGREWGRAEYQYDGINAVTYEYYDRASPFYACFLSFVSEDTDGYDKCLKDFEDVFDSFEFTE